MPLYIFLFLLCLTACSRGPVQEATKDLCTGTKKSYQIKGTWYHPQDHYDYEESGIASWYGPGFHKRPKSCGNQFNMHELSAAHKTLPIPSVVEVKNLENGKKLKLVVDDRGPFVEERIIDLSKKAAIELGLHGKGLASVQVTAIPDESKALSDYLKQYGRYGRVPDGRSWSDIYYQEISGKNLYRSIETPPMVTSPIIRQAIKPIQKRSASPALMPKQHLPLSALNSIIYQHSQPLPKHKREDLEHREIDQKALEQEIENILDSSPLSRSSSILSKKGSSLNRRIYIETGAFVQQQNAEKLKKRLEGIAPASLAPPYSNQPFFKLKIGPYSNENEARKIMGKLKEWGYYGATLKRY